MFACVRASVCACVWVCLHSYQSKCEIKKLLIFPIFWKMIIIPPPNNNNCSSDVRFWLFACKEEPLPVAIAISATTEVSRLVQVIRDVFYFYFFLFLTCQPSLPLTLSLFRVVCVCTKFATYRHTLDEMADQYTDNMNYNIMYARFTRRFCFAITVHIFACSYLSETKCAVYLLKCLLVLD